MIQLTPSDIVASMGFIIALISAYISYLTYRRDDGYLGISVKLGSMLEASGSTEKKEGIFFRIVNRGRRSVTLAGVLGTPDNLVRRLFSKILPIKRRWITLPNKVIAGFVTEKDGRFKTLAEGEIIDQMVFTPECDDLIKFFANSMTQFWVTDTKGKEYYLPQRLLRQIKKDFKKRKNTPLA